MMLGFAISNDLSSERAEEPDDLRNAEQQSGESNDTFELSHFNSFRKGSLL
jgi:hypothetical protein